MDGFFSRWAPAGRTAEFNTKGFGNSIVRYSRDVVGPGSREETLIIAVRPADSCTLQLLESKLPRELYQFILMLAGAGTCVLWRDHAALVSLLRAHIHQGSATPRIPCTIASQCIRTRWGKGLDALITSGLWPLESDSDEAWHKLPAHNLDAIQLSDAAIKLMWQVLGRSNSHHGIHSSATQKKLAILVFSSFVNAGGVDYDLIQWCTERLLPFAMHIGEQLVKYGANLVQLHELCIQLGMHDTGDTALVQIVTDYAAIYGRTDLLHWYFSRCQQPELFQFNVKNVKEMLLQSAKSGCIDAIKLIYAQYPSVDILPLMNAAVEYGRFDVLVWLYALGHNQIHFDRSLTEKCAEIGCLKTIQFIYDNEIGDITEHTIDCAAANGHLPLVIWLHQVLCSNVTTWGATRAARRGFLEMVQWVYTHAANKPTNRAVLLSDICVAAAEAGHHEIVRWMLTQDSCVIDVSRIFSATIQSGDLELLQWLYPFLQINSRIPRQADCNLVLSLAYIDMAEWLHKHELFLPEITEDVALLAVKSESTDLIAWLCKRTALNANRKNYDKLQKCIEDTFLKIAAHRGQLGIVRWAHARRSFYCGNSPLISPSILAATNGHLSIVCWLYENCICGRTDTYKVLNAAANHGYLNIVQFLCNCSDSICVTMALKSARKNEHADVIVYLQKYSKQKSTP